MQPSTAPTNFANQTGYPGGRNLFTPEEYGRAQPTPPAALPGGQPTGDARFPVPHINEFLGVWNWSNRSYPYWYDEAMAHGRENAERMRFDPVIDACMSLRTYASSLIPGRIEPDDPENPFEVECATKAQKILNRTPGLLFATRWLLDDGIFKGRTGLKQRWQWVTRYGRQWNTITKFEPIDGDKLVFKWDGRVGILVAPTFAGKTEPSERGPVWYAGPEWRDCLCVHEFEPEDVSYYNVMRQGAIHGVGIRGKLFWLWALKSHIWALATDYLEWFSRGLTVFNFDAGNPAQLAELQRWVNGQIGSHAMFFPRFRGGEPDWKPIDRYEANTGNAQFLQSLITTYFDDIIKLKIVGQTLTSGVGSTGLGSGVASAHKGTFDNVVKYDCVALDDTRTVNWCEPWYRSNFPGIPPGRWVSDLDDPEAQSAIENAQILYEMGAAIPEQQILDAAGIGTPKQGDTILSNLAQNQPAAVEGAPDSVPQVQGSGQPGQQSEAVQLPNAQGLQQDQALKLDRRTAVALFRASKRGDNRAVQLLRKARLKITS